MACKTGDWIACWGAESGSFRFSLSSIKWDRVLKANKISNIQIFQFLARKENNWAEDASVSVEIMSRSWNTFTAQSDLLMGVVDVRLLSSHFKLQWLLAKGPLGGYGIGVMPTLEGFGI